MAKGYQKNKERIEQVSLLGKTLVRRAKKKCELCDVQGESMSVIEIEPAPKIPDPDHAVLVCSTCQSIIDTDSPNPTQSRFLETAIWSEVPAVQVTAVRICQKLAAQGVNWAKDLLDTVYLSPEAEEWLNQ